VVGLHGWALAATQATAAAPTPTATATTAAPSPTPSPTSTSTATAGASTATATTSTTTYAVPGFIPSDCSSDTTSALTSFINGVPDNSTIAFATNGCYLVQGTLEFRSRNGLTFEGNGATVKATTVSDDTRSHCASSTAATWCSGT
jgi:hypothetical protein